MTPINIRVDALSLVNLTDSKISKEILKVPIKRMSRPLKIIKIWRHLDSTVLSDTI